MSNGAKQAIAQVVQAVCGPGDEVLIPAPYWVSYPEMARLAGATPVVLSTSPVDGFVLSPEALEAALTPASRLLILCTPSNPTGCVYPPAALAALAAVVARHPRLMVLSDEIYEHIIYPPAVHASFAALPGMWPRTATVNGFSKAFAMTGWRLGYVAAPSWVATACAAIQGQTTSGASSVAQRAGVAALGLGKAGGAPVAGMVAAFRARRDYVASRIAAWPGAVMPLPDGAFYALPHLGAYTGPTARAPGYEGPIETTDDLCAYLLRTSLVALVPGEAFGAPGTVRLSYAASDEVLRTALDRVEAALAAITPQPVRR